MPVAETTTPPAGDDSAAAALPPRRRRWTAAGVVLAALVVLVGVLGLGWRVTGGHWEIVATPSMGQTAPVGSLVFTRPADQVVVGDIVSYHPPGAAGETITHRVVLIDSQGGLHTRGDINAADDPWTLHDPDLVGRVVSIWWGLGWLVKALPLLLVGGLVIWWATKLWATDRWRVPVRIFGFSALVSVAALLLRPFVGMVLLSTTADSAGTHATLVSTGLLPIRITAATGGDVDLHDGQVGTLTTQIPAGSPGVELTSALHLPLWLWIGLIGLCLLPLGYALIIGYQPRQVPPPDDTQHDAGYGDNPTPQPPPPPAFPPPTDPGLYTHLARHRRAPTARWAARALMIAARRAPAARWAAGALMIAALIAAVTSAPTSAGFVAAVTNTGNTAAAAASFFTCTAATSAIGAANTLFTYPLADSPVTAGSTAADVSGNARKGVYSINFTTSTSRPCLRDTTAAAVTLTPTSAQPADVYPASSTSSSSLNVFTEAIWFKTSSTTGGRLIGWGNSYNGTSSTYDRHLFLSAAGNVAFGVYPGTVKVVASPKTYNNGAWHQVVASLSTAGMALYLDGALVAADPTVSTAEGGTGNTGYWRVGYDNVTGWGTYTPATNYFTGSLAWASVFTTALTPSQIKNLYTAGT